MKTFINNIKTVCIALMLFCSMAGMAQTTCATAVSYTYPASGTVTSYSNKDYWFTVTTPSSGIYAFEIANGSGSGKITNASVYIGSCSSPTLCAIDSLIDSTFTGFLIPLSNSVSTTYYVHLSNRSASAITFSVSTIRQLYIGGQLSYQSGNPDTLMASVVGPSGTASYTWMPGSIHTAQIISTATVNTTYTLTYSDGLGTLTDSITARPFPPLVLGCQLVLNGGFENDVNPGASDGLANIQVPTGCNPLSGFFFTTTEGPQNWISPTCGTPDYYNTVFPPLSLYPYNIVGVPYNICSNATGLLPHSGSAYAGFITYYNAESPSYREYIQEELACQLVTGQVYNISYWVSSASASTIPAPTPLNATPSNNIGAYFSSSAIGTSANSATLNYTPQVNAPNVINDPNTWVQVSGTITGGGQQYITVGNFYDDPHTSPYPSNKASYYFIDDISITPATPTITASSCSSGSITLTAYGVPNSTLTTWAGPGSYTATGSSVSVPSPTANVTYTCTVHLNYGCASCTNLVTTYTLVPTTPCSGTQPSTYTVTTTSTYNPGTGYIANNLYINSGNYTITSSVSIAPTVSITVASGATLTIAGAWLHVCNPCGGVMWQGIVVNNGATLIMETSSGNDNIVEDAVQAVYTSSGTSTPNYTITHTFFNNNSNDIYIDANTADLSAQRVYDNLFTCSNYHSHSLSATGNLNGIATDIRSHTPNNPSTTNPPDLTIAGARTQYGVYVNTGNITDPIVVGSNSGGGSNTFDNMDFGIYANASNLTAYSNIFENLTGNSTDLIGIGIYCTATVPGHCSPAPCSVANTLIVGNPSTTIVSGEANTFTNCLAGVYTINMQDVYINNNTFNNETTATAATYSTSGTYTTGGYGVWQNNFAYHASATNFEYMDFANNSVQNCANGHFMTFDELYNTNALGSGNSMNIQGNSITATAPNYCNYGLYFSQGNAGSVSATVPYNALSVTTNTITNINTSAIYLLNVAASKEGFMQIYNNGELSVKYNPACTTLLSPRVAAISMYGSYNTRILYNTNIRITGFSGSSVPAAQYIGGIYSYLSPQNKINCNTVSNMGEDFVYEGNSSNPGFNWMNNSMDYSQYGLVLRSSGIMGEQGVATTTVAINNSGSPLWAASAHFTDETLADNSDPGSGVGSALYTLATACTYSPCTNGVGLTGGTPYSGTTLLTATSSNAITCGSGGDRLSGNNNQVTSNNAQATTDSLYYQNILSTIADNSYHYPVYDAETRWGLQYMVSSRYPGLTPANGYEHAKTLAAADAAMANSDYGTALSLTNDFAAGNVIESNWQTVNPILIKAQNDTLSSADASTLQTVASQCPHSGGHIVFTARALLTAYYQKPMEYPNDCPATTTGTGNRIENTAGINQIKANGNQLSLYPNPSTGKLYISNFTADQKNASIEITDVTGKLIAKQQSPISNGLVELNLDVNDGVYFVKVVTDTGTMQVQKVIISK